MAPRVTRVLHVDPRQPDPAALRDAAAALLAGQLVVFPTETVYGLGGHALDPAAVDRIFAAKGRPFTDPLIVHLGSADELSRVAADVSPEGRALAARFWPGPLTLILPKQARVPDRVTAGRSTVAVRVPAHPIAAALLAAAGVPVAAPSANRFSRPSPTTAAHVLADLDGAVDLVIDGGPTDIGVESTIVDVTVTPPLVRRAGGVPIDAIRAVVPQAAYAQAVIGAETAQIAPGQLLRHYAPQARVTVFDGDIAAVAARLAREVRALVGGGTAVGVLAPDDVLTALAPSIAGSASRGRVTAASLGPHAAPAAAAHVLFARLRDLDAVPVDVILAAGPAREGLGAAVWDRLMRAAEGRIVPA